MQDADVQRGKLDAVFADLATKVRPSDVLVFFLELSAGDAFIRSEPDAGLYATLKFVDDRKFLFIELRAIPRVG